MRFREYKAKESFGGKQEVKPIDLPDLEKIYREVYDRASAELERPLRMFEKLERENRAVRGLIETAVFGRANISPSREVSRPETSRLERRVSEKRPTPRPESFFRLPDISPEPFFAGESWLRFGESGKIGRGQSGPRGGRETPTPRPGRGIPEITMWPEFGIRGGTGGSRGRITPIEGWDKIMKLPPNPMKKAKGKKFNPVAENPFEVQLGKADSVVNNMLRML